MENVVATRSGKLEGTRSRGVRVFRGIPYAEPPVEGLRFRPPEPVRRWRGIRSATRFGPAAPQSSPLLLLVRRLAGTGTGSQSEDCLYLNVWTPAADRRRCPVLVWIHGGAFVMGSGSAGLYSGVHLARRGDVVVVTINYRLGALGSLNHPDLAAAGIAPNVGIRDQIAALEWVRDHIADFGGDPENVTLFGESAGGMSVGTLLGTPAAGGLFHRAIMQSGAAHNVSRRDRAASVAETFLFELGLGLRDAESLRGAPVQEILGAQQRTTGEIGRPGDPLTWQPSLDADLLPEHPLDAIPAGSSRSVPVLVGSNRDEWKLFMLGDAEGRKLDESGLRRRLERVLPGEDPNGIPHVEVALEAYRARAPSRSPADVWVAFQSGRVFHYPAVRLAELHSTHTPETFRYLFTWSPPLVGARIGACHGIELPFVFGTGRDGLLAPLLGLTPESRGLSRRVQDAWLAFARTGDPRHEGLPDWPAFDAQDRAVMSLGSECFPKKVPYDEEHAFWATRLYAGGSAEELRVSA